MKVKVTSMHDKLTEVTEAKHIVVTMTLLGSITKSNLLVTMMVIQWVPKVWAFLITRNEIFVFQIQIQGGFRTKNPRPNSVYTQMLQSPRSPFSCNICI